MTFKKLGLASAALMLAVGVSAPALAQTPLPPVTGPALPGVCVFDEGRVMAESTVGKFATSRLQSLGQQANSELTTEAATIENDFKTLQGQKAGLSAQVYQQRVDQLQLRDRELHNKADVRSREFQATQAKAQQIIYEALIPIVRDAFRQHSCSVLLKSAATDLWTPSLEITDTVIASLNTKLTQFQLDRVQAPAAPER